MRGRVGAAGAGLIGLVAAVAVVAAVGPLGLGPFGEASPVAVAAGTELNLPAWILGTVPPGPNITHPGSPGTLAIPFATGSNEALTGTLSAPRPFGILVGTPGAVGNDLCGLSHPPPPCAASIESPSYLFVGPSSTTHADVGQMALGLHGPTNVLPPANFEILLYHEGNAPDPIDVSAAMVLQPA